jgi:hypothetical protein
MFICEKCDEDFEPTRKRQSQKLCPGCNKKRNRTSIQQYKYHGRDAEGYISWLHSKLRDRVQRKKKSVQLNVTRDELMEIYKRQKGKCAFCELEMTHKPDQNLYTNLSIDRIDSDGDYEKTNIRFVFKVFNVLKSKSSDKEFEDLIIDLAEAFKKRRAVVPSSPRLPG